MNFTIKQNDSVVDLIQNRIRFFKEVHERHFDSRTRSICQTKITTLEMVLNDVLTLKSIQNSIEKL